jgi:opacity protein-like surface antigen
MELNINNMEEKMKKIILVSILAMFAFAMNAYSAEDGWYMSGNVGLSIISDSDMGSYDEEDLEDVTGEDLPAGTTGSAEMSFDKGWMISAAAGYDFGNFRLESELFYVANDLDEISATVNAPSVPSVTVGVPIDGDMTGLTLLFNGYYDFNAEGKVHPYITGGLGYSFVDATIEVEGEDFSDDDSVFTYQVGAGLLYDMTDNVSLDLRYRYLQMSDPMEIEVSGHQVSAGLMLRF